MVDVRFCSFFWSREGKSYQMMENRHQAFLTMKMEAMCLFRKCRKKIIQLFLLQKKGLDRKYPMMMSGSWSIQQLETSYQDQL